MHSLHPLVRKHSPRFIIVIFQVAQEHDHFIETHCNWDNVSQKRWILPLTHGKNHPEDRRFLVPYATAYPTQTRLQQCCLHPVMRHMSNFVLLIICLMC